MSETNGFRINEVVPIIHRISLPNEQMLALLQRLDFPLSPTASVMAERHN